MNFVVNGISKIDGKLRARQIGEYSNFDDAVAAAKQHIDDFLYREHKRAVWHGISAEKLYLLYKNEGEAMLVEPKEQRETIALRFDHLDYAAKKCHDICTNTPVRERHLPKT